MAATFRITDTFTPFLEQAPTVLKAAGRRGAQQTTPKVLARMEANAPRLTGVMASRLTANGGQVGIFDNSEEASVALFNEYSPNHQPFMRPAAQSSVGDLIEAMTSAIQGAEADLVQ